MYKVRGFLDNKLVINWRMPHLPFGAVQPVIPVVKRRL